ncbi:hypothetical protein [Ruegeria lacuscaerulensis]|uniref:hypothetical protein n=1 Tax=Ruegeria lacuscaerulensis TaxID=55218 RepID=UPI00147B1CC4|nr:hypothetical protein [Ruegeria lacuscaerulensis]
MRPNSSAIALIGALTIIPVASLSQTFKETFECDFGPGIVGSPTPQHLVFSVDEYGRSAYLHEVQLPNVETLPGHARIKRDGVRNLSIAWSGKDYVYSDTGRTLSSSASRSDVVDLKDQEFAVFLDRKNMKATARSESYLAVFSRSGFAEGNCRAVTTPN